MNELLYLLGPLGCVAMMVIAAILIARAGRHPLIPRCCGQGQRAPADG